MNDQSSNGDGPEPEGGVQSSSPTASVPLPPLVISAIGGSPGYAMGPTWVIDTKHRGVVHKTVEKSQVPDEIVKFERAVGAAAKELGQVVESKGIGAAERAILEAYILMVQDPLLRERVLYRIQKERRCSEWALDGAIREIADTLRGSGDSYLAERSHDLEFVGHRVLKALTGVPSSISLPNGDVPYVLVAHELSPAETAMLSKNRVLALVTEVGTRTSHTAILARAMGIPAVVGAADLLSKLRPGEIALVDGSHGLITLRPNEIALKSAKEREQRFLAVSQGLWQRRKSPARTACGVNVKLCANIELPSEAPIAMDSGAQGIGLYRTEFLYVDRQDLPSEDEQYETYAGVLEATAPQAVTLRTFDIGGDKFASSFAVPSEMNPALGLRAVRLGLRHPEVFLAQLRAMVRASAHGRMLIMLPMIAALHEFRGARELLKQAISQVDAKGQPRASAIPLGMMVEVPSAALLADAFAQEADFFSIGTNDLVQYTLAVDRGSNALANLASFFDPAVLNLVSRVVRAAEGKGRGVAVCGTMASDPLAAILLLGMGLREFSMEASALSHVKETLNRVTIAEAESAWDFCSRLPESDAIEREVLARFGPRITDLLDRELS